jgi:ankyrin repeat protein
VILRRLAGSIAVVLFGLLPAVSSGQSFEQLLKAADAGDIKAVGALLDKGLEPNTADPQGNTLLMIAARQGHLELVRFLIKRKASVARRSPHGDTALMMASLGGHLEIARLLVDNGAEINHDGWAPLHYAAFDGGPALIKYLVGKGANKDSLAPNGYTALMLATMKGKIESVRALLELDVDLSLRSPKGQTALGIAKGTNNEEMVTLLRRAGVVD